MSRRSLVARHQLAHHGHTQLSRPAGPPDQLLLTGPLRPVRGDKDVDVHAAPSAPRLCLPSRAAFVTPGRIVTPGRRVAFAAPPRRVPPSVDEDLCPASAASRRRTSGSAPVSYTHLTL